MSAEIIDQANELAERRLEMTIQNMRINHNAVSATHCHDCGKRYHSVAGNWWLAASAALIVRKSLKNVGSIGGRDVQTNSERSALCRLPRMAGNYRQQRRQDGSLLAAGADQHRKHRPL